MSCISQNRQDAILEHLCSFKLDGTGTSLAAQVSSFLKGLILSGKIKGGEQLPNEVDLAKILKVSRMTTREAVLNIVQQELANRHVGKGTFINSLESPPKILWVCGHDMFKDDISPYYTHSLRAFTRECKEHNWQVEPIWIDNSGNPAVEAYVSGGKCNYAGYAFTSCPPSNPLLKAVRERKRPYVQITFDSTAPRSVSTDVAQGVTLCLDHLKRENPRAESVTIICNENYLEQIGPFLNAQSIVRAKVTSVAEPSEMSTAINAGYQAMNKIISSGDDWTSLLIFDDILALGASNAILRSGSEKTRSTRMVVRGGGYIQIPFPNPVTYLTIDVELEACQAARILHEQIEGNIPEPDPYIGKYSLRTSL